MEPWWWGVGACIAAFLWTAYLDVRHDSERRLAAWWVARTRTLGGWTGPVSFLVSAGALACFSAAAWAAVSAASATGHHLWALAVIGPAVLIYAPVAMATAPTQAGAYRPWREELSAAGADPRQQRAIAWWAGPPSLLGVLAIGIGLWSALVP
jgi:hypothetical protein